MFSGIIEAVGTLRGSEAAAGDKRLCIDCGELDLADVKIGDSIAVSGVCLTVVALEQRAFYADVSRETLTRTTLGQLAPGAAVNLEKALLASARLGGHLVSGHVDGVGVVVAQRADSRSQRFDIRVADELAKYIATKGSVCVDGVSLTVNAVDGNRFAVNIVPHTLDRTIICSYEEGVQVNIEVDIIARYLERLLAAGAAGGGDRSLQLSTLQAAGFLC